MRDDEAERLKAAHPVVYFVSYWLGAGIGWVLLIAALFAYWIGLKTRAWPMFLIAGLFLLLVFWLRHWARHETSKRKEPH